MAITVKPIPTLSGDAAEVFLRQQMENEEKRGSVDFSKQISIARKILEKSKVGK